MQHSLETTRLYTDANSLAQLKQASTSQSAEAREEVAKQFEAMFMQMMLKQMREATLADGILDSEQSKLYTEMMHNQLSLQLADQYELGIKQAILQQLEAQAGNATVPGSQGREILSFNKTQRFDVTHSINPFKGHTFDSSSEFIHELRPLAQQAANKLGVSAELLLSQSALETGWGKKIIHDQQGNNSFNLFSIKADPSWKGQKVNVGTLEYRDGIAVRETAPFRVYESYADSFNDYVNFLQENPRYHKALKVIDSDESFIKDLQEAGYATDPDYANKIISILHSEKM